MTSAHRLQAQAVQRLHIRLLYSEPLIKAYREHPEQVLLDHGIQANWRGSLPDPDVVGFKVEFHGRRMQIYSELRSSFSATIAHLTHGSIPPADQPWLAAFLASDHFFLSKNSLPDVTRVGRGYELTSRFFFWLRDHIVSGAYGDRQGLRDDLFLDFACWLDQIAHRTSNPEWERYRHGFVWSINHAGGRLLRLLTQDRKVQTHSASNGSIDHTRMLSLEELVP